MLLGLGRAVSIACSNHDKNTLFLAFFAGCLLVGPVPLKKPERASVQFFPVGPANRFGF